MSAVRRQWEEQGTFPPPLPPQHLDMQLHFSEFFIGIFFKEKYIAKFRAFQVLFPIFH